MGKTRKVRKAIGAYYTPIAVAQTLTDWALRSPNDTLFDPSFGRCAFFLAGIRTLARLGSPDPFSQLAGFDIDPDVENHLKALPGSRSGRRRFKIGEDFLTSRDYGPNRWQFDAVIGNPPYIRHHSLSREQIDVAQGAIRNQGYHLPRTANYWSYFVLHSLAFLRPGGRLVMVLPLALLNADYAIPVQHVLKAGFASSRFVILDDCLFPNVQEGSVIVLCDGWGKSSTQTTLLKGRTSDLAGLLSQKSSTERGGASSSSAYRSWQRDLLPTTVCAFFDEITERPDMHRLGDLAGIHIGVVTGSNAFFLMRPSEAKMLGIIDRYLHPCLSATSDVSSLNFSRNHVRRLAKADKSCLLLVPPKGRLSRAVKTYIATEQGAAAAKRHKCRIRSPWYRITDLRIPDAFLIYVNGGFPKLILNQASILSTNTIHRVLWKDKRSRAEQQLISLSFISSLGGLSAELVGRIYGGGALKLEPSDAARMFIALPDLPARRITSVFGLACTLAENGRWAEVRNLADDLILIDGLGMAARDVELVKFALSDLRHLRLQRCSRRANAPT